MADLKPFPIITYDEESENLPGGNVPQRRKGMPKSTHLVGIVAGGAIAVLLTGGAGAYWWLSRYHAQTPSHQASAKQAPTPGDTSSSRNTKYVSNGKDLSLAFTYPADWSVSPATSHNMSDQTVTLTSPYKTMTAAEGKTVVGKIVLQMRPASAALSELSSGAAKAALDSIQIAYTSPTPAQHAYPFVTYINLGGGAGSFDEVILTGALQFTKGQPVSEASLQGLDPIISARFYACTTNSCSGAGASPLEITSATWENADIFLAVQTILKSLQIN